jgi:hypothetical protein
MAYRYRSGYSRRADVFPQRVAIGAILVLALFITLAVWGFLPADSGPGLASVEPVATLDAGRADPPPAVPSRPEPPAVTVAAPPSPVVDPTPAPVAPASPRAAVDEATTRIAADDRNNGATGAPRVAPRREGQDAGTTLPARAVVRQRSTQPPTPPAPDASGLRVTSAGEEGSAGAQALAEWRFGAAAVHYQRAVTLEPRNAAFRTGYARALFHHGALPQAAAQLEEAVLWNPGHADAFALLGEIRWAQDERAAAEQAYRRYLELESDSRRRASAEARLRRITGQDAVASGSRLR